MSGKEARARAEAYEDIQDYERKHVTAFLLGLMIPISEQENLFCGNGSTKCRNGLANFVAYRYDISKLKADLLWKRFLTMLASNLRE